MDANWKYITFNLTKKGRGEPNKFYMTTKGFYNDDNVRKPIAIEKINANTIKIRDKEVGLTDGREYKVERILNETEKVGYDISIKLFKEDIYKEGREIASFICGYNMFWNFEDFEITKSGNKFLNEKKIEINPVKNSIGNDY